MLTNKEENVCFICFELKAKREKKPKRLKNQNLYIKTCDCDGFIHNTCLKIWYDVSKKCPICREIMLDKNAVVAVLITMNENDNNDNRQNQNQNQVQNLGIRMRIYVYIQKNWNKVASIINIAFLLYLSISFYYSVFNKVNSDLI